MGFGLRLLHRLETNGYPYAEAGDSMTPLIELGSFSPQTQKGTSWLGCYQSACSNDALVIWIFPSIPSCRTIDRQVPAALAAITLFESGLSWKPRQPQGLSRISH